MNEDFLGTYTDDDTLEIVEVTIFDPNLSARDLNNTSKGLFWVRSTGALEVDGYVHKFGEFVNGDKTVATLNRGVVRVKNVLKCQRNFYGDWVANADNSPLRLI